MRSSVHLLSPAQPSLRLFGCGHALHKPFQRPPVPVGVFVCVQLQQHTQITERDYSRPKRS